MPIPSGTISCDFVLPLFGLEKVEVSYLVDSKNSESYFDS